MSRYRPPVLFSCSLVSVGRLEGINTATPSLTRTIDLDGSALPKVRDYLVRSKPSSGILRGSL
jgi:hypothetical protein